MKILLFGGEGQLGYELMKRARDLNFEMVSPLESEVDITEKEQVLIIANNVQPDIIINAAAYTAVDKQEEEQELAFKVNCDGAACVAAAAKATKSRLIHISTDYVYGGSFTEPIKEDAPTMPPNVYGKSKLAGDEKVKDLLGSKALIIRTASLHGQKGQNFVHTMLKLFSERDVVKVVNDQRMSPTWAGWLAEAILDLSRIECGGIVHACSGGNVSWYEFATEILSLAMQKLENGESIRIEPVKTEEFPRPAKRNSFSVLDTSKLALLLGRPPLEWKEGLRAHLKEIDMFEE